MRDLRAAVGWFAIAGVLLLCACAPKPDDFPTRIDEEGLEPHSQSEGAVTPSIRVIEGDFDADGPFPPERLHVHPLTSFVTDPSSGEASIELHVE
ncbi:MAG: hypothetical protein AAGB34_06255, partial [Planctomycetota bacterium]